MDAEEDSAKTNGQHPQKQSTKCHPFLKGSSAESMGKK
jgi:hypothetical protein